MKTKLIRFTLALALLGLLGAGITASGPVATATDQGGLQQASGKADTDGGKGTASCYRLGVVVPIAVGLAGVPTIPQLQAQGWALCNGQTPAAQGIANAELTDPTPNINGNGWFVRGGGTAGVTQTGSVGDHTHSAGFSGSLGTAGDHTHANSFGIANAGNHGHAENTSANCGTGGPGYRRDFSQDCGGLTIYAQGISTDAAGDHSHTITGGITNAGTHTHTLSGTPTINTYNPGGETRPANVAVLYFIKVKCGDAVAPTVSSVVVQTGLTIDVTFSKAMDLGVTTAANYAVSGPGQGTLAANPNSVALVSGNTYRLTWSAGEMRNGSSITVTVTNVYDTTGNLIGLPNNGSGTAIGTPPTCVVSTTSPSPTMNEPIPFAITFSESVSGFDQTKVTVLNGSITSFSGSGTTYNISVTPSASSTTVSVSVAAGVAQDAAGNGNLISNTVPVVYDNVAPTCTVSGPVSLTNNNPITFTITFSDPVTGLTAGEIVVTGGSKGALAGGGASYSIPVTPSGQGSVTCLVPAGAAQKAGGKDNMESNTCDITYDSIAPTCTVSGPVSPTNTSEIDFTINFSEPVAGLPVAGITVTNGTKGLVTGSGSGPYTLPVFPSGQGPVTCQVTASAAQDAAGNGNTLSNLLSITYDSVGPTCTVTGPASPTNSSPITFTMTFDETVTGLDAGSITVTGGAKGTLGGSGTTYTLDVTPSGQGAVTCQVTAGAAQDAAGNGNVLSNNRSITFDSLPPACTVTGPVSPANVSPITFTLTFGDPVHNLNASLITVSGGTPGTPAGVGPGPLYTAYTLDVTPSGQGAVACQVQDSAAQDAAGNGNSLSNNLIIVYDSVAPTCTVTGPSSPTNTSPIVFTLTFSESVTGLTAGGVTVTNGSKGALTGGADTYTLPVTPSGQGAVTCQVTAGAAQDDATNGNVVSNNRSITYDSVGPTCLVTGPTGPVSTSPISVTLTFSEPVTGLTSGAITVTGGAASALTGSDADYTLDIMPAGNGTVTCDVPQGAAQDAAGNPNDVSDLYSVEYVSARPACNVSASRTAFSSNPISFVITFSEPVTSFDIGMIDVSGAAKDALTGSSKDYTLTVIAPAEGPVTCHVQDGAAVSVSAGQPSTESNTHQVTFDTTPPTCLVTGPVSPTNVSPFVVTLTFSESVTGLTVDGLAVTNGIAYGLVGNGTSYSVTVSAADQGPVTVAVDGGAAQDTAGNGNVVSNTLSVTYDSIEPDCLVSGPASPTNGSPITFLIDFTEPVAGLLPSLITVTGGTAGTPVGVGPGPYYTEYTLDVTPAGQGAATCQVLAGAAQDGAGNASTISNTLSITYDSIVPVCTVTAPASPNKTAPLVFTLTFGEPVLGLLAPEVQLTNGTPGALNTTDNRVFTLEVNPSGQGTVICQVPAGAAQDAAGNGNTLSNEGSVLFDSMEPTCVVTGSASSTNTSPIVFTLTFDEPVSGLLASGMQLTNGTAGALNTTDNQVYTLEVTPADQGAVTCQVPVGAAQDAAGNGNAVSNTASVTFDSVGPTCTVTPPSGPVHNPPVVFTISFSEPVSGLTSGNISIGNGIAGAITGSGAGPYTFEITPLTLGDVTCQVLAGAALDAAGNGSEVSNIASVYYDNPNPACWITGPASPTNDAPILFSIHFGAPVTGLDISEIVVTNGTKVSLTGSTMSYSLTVAPIGQGAVTCQVPAGAAQDSGVHDNTESNLLDVVYDTVPPTAVLALDGPSPTTDSVLAFSVDFDESVGSTFTQGQITLAGTLAAGASVTDIAQDGNNYTVTVTVVDTNADGTLGITVGSGVTDLAGNAYAGASSALYTVRNWFGFQDQPQGARRYVGDSAGFTVTLNSHGNSVPTYQWWFDDVGKAAPAPIGGATSSSLTVGPLTLGSAGDYWCVVGYMGVPEVSDHATLEVQDRIQITGQPVGAAKQPGQSYTFTVTATGGYVPLGYQWKKDGAPIANATDAAFTISSLDETDAGSYVVDVTDANTDSQTSIEALLTVGGTPMPVAGAAGLALLLAVMAAGGVLKRRRVASRRG